MLLKRSDPLLSETIEAFLIDGKARRLSPRTLESYRFHLGRFTTWHAEQWPTAPISSVDAHTLRAYLAGQHDKGLSPWTVHGSARVLRTFWRWCAAEDLVQVNPMARVKMPKLPKAILPAFTTEDIDRLLAACQTYRDRALIFFLIDTGVRRAELAGLTGADVDTQARHARVREGKGGKDRVVFFGVQTQRAMVRYYLEHKPAPDERVFGLSSEGLRTQLKRIGKRAGVDHCNPHTFRRTCALWSLRAGMDIHRLARMLGHADIQVLRSYLALVEDDIRAAHAAHGAVDNFLK